MTSAQSLIWHAAGCPPVDGAKGKLLKNQPAQCVITGEREDMTAPLKKHSAPISSTNHFGPATPAASDNPHCGAAPEKARTRRACGRGSAHPVRTSENP